jgi:hypothetical protein
VEAGIAAGIAFEAGIAVETGTFWNNDATDDAETAGYGFAETLAHATSLVCVGNCLATLWRPEAVAKKTGLVV